MNMEKFELVKSFFGGNAFKKAVGLSRLWRLKNYQQVPYNSTLLIQAMEYFCGN